MTIVFIILLGFSCWMSCKKDLGAALGVGFVCFRTCYFVFAPIVGAAIYRSLNSNSESIDKVYELESVAKCMDDQTTLDTELIVSDLNE